MSQIGFRWYNTSPSGALVPFNDRTPHVPNEPVQAECLTYGKSYGNRHYYVDRQGNEFNVIGLTQAQVRDLVGDGIISPAVESNHHAPMYDCTCGHYIFKWCEDAMALPYVGGYRKLCKILVAVEWWGKFVEHDLGYRTEWTTVRAACTFGRKIHPVYEIDKVLTVEQLSERWEEQE